MLLRGSANAKPSSVRLLSADSWNMVDVNEIVQRYRLGLRTIWNECFWADPSLRDWESVYAFRKLKLPLLNALVAHALDLSEADHSYAGRHALIEVSHGDVTLTPTTRA